MRQVENQVSKRWKELELEKQKQQQEDLKKYKNMVQQNKLELEQKKPDIEAAKKKKEEEKKLLKQTEI